MAEALALEPGAYPDLLKPFQERVGSLMYACTSTRPDIAYVVHKLCRALQKPTPGLMDAANRVIAYLGRHSHVGLTYTSGYSQLTGYADAS